VAAACCTKSSSVPVCLAAWERQVKECPEMQPQADLCENSLWAAVLCQNDGLGMCSNGAFRCSVSLAAKA